MVTPLFSHFIAQVWKTDSTCQYMFPMCNVLVIRAPLPILSKCFRMGPTVPLIASAKAKTDMDQSSCLRRRELKGHLLGNKTSSKHEMSWFIMHFLFPSLQALLNTSLEQQASLLKPNQFHSRWWQMNIIFTTLPVLQCSVGIPGSLMVLGEWVLGLHFFSNP